MFCKMVIHNIQPITINNDEYYLKKKFFTDTERYGFGDRPEWLSNYQKLYYSTYKDIIGNRQLDFNLDEYLEEVNTDEFLIKGEYSIKDVFVKDSFKVDLLYDCSTNLWIIDYCFTLSFTKKQFDEYVINENAKVNGDLDLYNAMRYSMIENDNKLHVTKAVLDYENIVKQEIIEFSKKNLEIDLNDSDINVGKISGNITNQIDLTEVPTGTEKYVVDNVFQLNNFAERITYNNSIIDIPENAIISFNGRFHTVCLKKKRVMDRYMSIMFHMVYSWQKINMQVDAVSDIQKYGISSIDDLNELEGEIKKIERLIEGIYTLRFDNEKFKRSIEVDNEEVYMKIEGLWSIEKQISELREYTSYLKSFLERMYNDQIAKNSKFQNKTLYIISILQIVALVSVWTDYLALFNSENEYSGWLNPVVEFFGGYQRFVAFNSVLPIVLIIVILILSFANFRNSLSKR